MVFGEGPSHAAVMLVGEEPGHHEDLEGRPFVGPAGRILDRALAEAGLDRGKLYVTNAVKHFKFLQRGKLRLHKKPSHSEIKACRPWLEGELSAIRPAVVVALGVTAALALFQRATPIGPHRGRLLDFSSGRRALVTVHPSYVLRLLNKPEGAAEYERFVADLKLVAPCVRGKTRKTKS